MSINYEKTPCEKCGIPFGIGDFPICPHGKPYGGTNIQAIHAKDRAVIYRNPLTGEVRTPARNDMPMPEQYVKQGYVREELPDIRAVRAYEKQSGKLHEESHYDSKNDSSANGALTDLTRERTVEIEHSTEVRRDLIQTFNALQQK
jgi:hypothetical protein